MFDFSEEMARSRWYRDGGGPRYLQLARFVTDLIRSGELPAGAQLPAERELADLAGVSRVTVRKAIAELVVTDLVEQRQGAGTFVREQGERFKQSLSSLVSFTENLEARGIASSSKVLQKGLFRPSTAEAAILGLSSSQLVARIHRLRSGDNLPMALEYSTIPEDILPRPDKLQRSLYALLRERGTAPTRAIQRVSAVNAAPHVAELLNLSEGSAVLQIERTAFLPSGRPIEFTWGIYRSDVYDFVSELRLE